MPPTVGTVDAMANEVIRDVAEGVDAYNYLVERGELDSATKRLSESFLVGEYLPPIRTLPRDKKRLSLSYAQKANQLVSAIEVKDYALAEKLVNEMDAMAKDFDNSKPMAAIQTAKTLAALHLAKAKNAAVGGDHITLETELKAATEIWPRNPQLADVAGMIFSEGNVQNKALVDFDQLLSQKNYRQISTTRSASSPPSPSTPSARAAPQGAREHDRDRERDHPRAGDREARRLRRRMGKRGDGLRQIPLRLEAEPGARRPHDEGGGFRPRPSPRAGTRAARPDRSSLAWFLKAQQEYPNSDFARKGVERLTKEILPDAT